MRIKYLLFLSFFALSTLRINAQWYTKSYVHQTLTRQYMVYVPANYNASNPASMVIALHGLGDNMTNFSQQGFNLLADTANIIVVVPQAISDPLAGTAWNSGAGTSSYYPNSTVNDVGFLNSLIDTIKANYSIHNSRVFMCGFSMGGFMTQRMALQSNTKLKAIASLSGTIGSGISNYAPGRSIPVAHFHGTADATVAYSGNSYGIDAIPLINFWITNNACNTPPDSSRFADIASDGYTIDLFKYTGSTVNNDVWFYRMNNAPHTVLKQPTNDITETTEMWRFFRRHFETTTNTPELAEEKRILAFPNPANNFINLILPETSEKMTIELYSIEGSCLYSKQISANNFHQIILNNTLFSNGIYILRVCGNTVNLSQQIIIQK